MRRWPAKYATLAASKTEKKKNPKSGRIAQHYRCNACDKEYVATGVQVDHIKPVVDPATGFTSWDTFIKRLYCGEKNLQVLCLTCHKTKTKKEQNGNKQSSKNK